MPLTENEELSIGPDALLTEIKKTFQTRSTLWIEEKNFTFNTITDAVKKMLGEGRSFPHPLTINALRELKLTTEELNIGMTLLVLGKDFTPFAKKLMLFLLELGADPFLLDLLSLQNWKRNQLLQEAFLEKLPKAAYGLLHIGGKIYEIDQDHTPLIHWALDSNNYDLVKVAILAGAKLDDRNRSGLPYTHCLSIFDSVSDLKRKIYFLIQPERELPNYGLKALELNTVIEHKPHEIMYKETAFEKAVSQMNNNAIDALMEVSEETNKSVFRSDDPSIWRLTVKAGMRHGMWDAFSVKIMQHALRMNERKPLNQQIDILGMPPADGFLQFSQPSKFAYLAVKASLPKSVNLALTQHPEWVNEPQYRSPYPLIHVALSNLTSWDEYETLWTLIIHGAKLTKYTKSYSNQNPLQRIDALTRHEVLIYLPRVPYQIYTNFCRFQMREAEKKLAEHLPKKQKISEPLWATQTRRIKTLFNKYSHGHIFFKTLENKTRDVQYNTFMMSYILSRHMMNMSRVVNTKKKPGTQDIFFSRSLLHLILSFVDLSALSCYYKKKRDWNDSDINFSKQDKDDFMKHALHPTLGRALTQCKARLLNYQTKVAEQKQARPPRQIVRVKRIKK